jgi:predicted nuclease of predicted toxin-antitoxin system
MEDDDILAWALAEERIVITIDKDFGTLAVALGRPHRGMVRLPDVSTVERQRLMEQVLTRHEKELETGAIITVSRSHIRVRPG